MKEKLPAGSLADLWKKWQSEKLSDIPLDEIEYWRTAFYSGAMALLEIVLTNANEIDDYLDMWIEEAREFERTELSS